MALKDIGNAFEDLANLGLVVGKKVFAQALADERDLEPEMVRELVERLHPDRAGVRVAEVVQETPSTRTLRLVSTGGALPPFRAGQFFTLFCEVDGVRTSRAYSISSPPSRHGHLDITVRKMPQGFVSEYLCEEAGPGDEFEISGPGGSFYHDPLTDTDDLVFLAGGSGVTPFMSMIREAVEVNSPLKMHLVYGSRIPDDIIFAEELAELACCFENLKVDLVISEPPEGYDGLCGLLGEEMLAEIIGDTRGKTFFMCGPHAMYDLCSPSLANLGVSPRMVTKELSGPPPDITLAEGWPAKLKASKSFTVRIAGTRKKFEAACGEPLLNSMERNGVTVDNLCRSGECGVCRTSLVEGEVFMPADVALRKADLAYGYIHPCMAYPVSDITIRL